MHDDDTDSHPTRVTRRQVLATAAALSGAAAIGGLGQPLGAAAEEREHADRLPRPELSGIEHIVLVMMENRSFDHFLGWLPEADGRQAGLTFRDAAGIRHPTHELAPDFQGCGFSDPDHSFAGGRVEYDGGRCDGWLRAGSNDVYCIGYYRRHDLPFFAQLAPRFVALDRYFCAILGPTFPNRIFQHAGTTDRLSNTPTISTLPTIWDRLAASGVSGRYYFSDLPVLGLWGAKYQSISRPISQFFLDASTGQLPSVAYLDPRFIGEDEGISNDDHPHADVRNGQAFLDSIYRAVISGPNWDKTVLVINYDEWGGFFDHVPPPAGAVTTAEQALGYTDGLRGFRVPCLVISPWSQIQRVSHRLFDHTSVLKLIEWRFGLEPLSVRDAAANNLATVLDFDEPRPEAPRTDVPAGPFGGPCPPTPTPSVATAAMPASPANDEPAKEWHGLRDLARNHGWAV